MFNSGFLGSDEGYFGVVRKTKIGYYSDIHEADFV